MAEEKPILKYVAIGCGILMLLAVTCGGFGFYACQSCVSEGLGQTEEAEAFLLDLRTGNREAAYARMSPTFRASHDRVAFDAALTRHPALTEHGAHSFNSYFTSPEGTTVGGMLATASGGYVPVELVLVPGASSDESFVGRVTVNGLLFGAGAKPAPTPEAR